MPPYHRILIIKPSSLGDIVHALPVLHALRVRYPSARIDWLVKREWAGVLERAEGLDRMWPVDRGLKAWLSVVPALRAAQYDLVLDLQGLFRSGVMAWLTGCRERIGFANGREGSRLFYRRRVAVPTADMHAVDRYLLLAAAVGAGHEGKPEFRLRPTAEDREEVGRLLRRAGLKTGTDWIAMNVSARWETKQWPAGDFADAADRLQSEGLGQVLMIGGPGDRRASETVVNTMRTPVIDLTGHVPLTLLPCLLGEASVLLTNDSGPMHIAAAMGTPVVALFGPTSPVRTGPYGEGHVVMAAGVACSPCFSRVCRNAVRLECLHRIRPEQVVDAVRRRLSQRVRTQSARPTTP
ncbi:lipopolysaccharide heptosyltransferase II [Candidatus Nitrospira bockiana]